MARRTHTGDCQKLQLWPFLPTCFNEGQYEGRMWSNWTRTGGWDGEDLVWAAIGDRDAGAVSLAYPSEDGYEALTMTLCYGWVEAPTCFGGLRYGWLCPQCDHVARTLYRPPGEPYFACRRCHGLLYESQYRTPKQRHTSRLMTRYRELLWRGFSRRHEQELFALMDWKNAQTTQERRKQAQAGQPKRSRGRPREKRPYQRRSPVTLSPRTSDTQAYCPRCRDRREMTETQTGTFRNGRPVLRGRCGACRCRLARLVSMHPRAGDGETQ